MRVYFVIDMKSFFASVECSLRGLDATTTNLVVADHERTEKTICLAVSMNMKKLGVKNRCRLFQIPDGIDYIVAKPRMKKYIEFASEIYAIYLKYIDKNDIHVYSIDECFLDVTDYLKLYNIKAKDFAKRLMSEIWDKLRIPSTCGIGSNMYLAKIALDIDAKKSKDRIGWLTEEKYIKTLSYHEPITDFWRISRGTRDRLKKYNITNMAGIREIDEEILYKEFGMDAEFLIDHAYGKEPCLMSDIKNYKSKNKSMSSSQILPCGYDFDKGLIVFKEMIQDLCYKMYMSNIVTNHVTFTIVYEDYSAVTKRVNMVECTNLFSIISKYLIDKFEKFVDRNKNIKGMAYSVLSLDKSFEHYDLFTDLKKIEKEKNLMEKVIRIKEKYGKNSLLKGIDFEDGANIRERNEMIGGHNSG